MNMLICNASQIIYTHMVNVWLSYYLPVPLNIELAYCVAELNWFISTRSRSMNNNNKGKDTDIYNYHVYSFLNTYVCFDYISYVGLFALRILQSYCSTTSAKAAFTI